MLLDADPFLTQLRKMYAETQGASVFVTMKPYTPPGESVTYTLVRAATNHAKISTLVSAKDHRRFSQQCTTVMQAAMSALTKRKVKARVAKSAPVS